MNKLPPHTYTIFHFWLLNSYIFLPPLKKLHSHSYTIFPLAACLLSFLTPLNKLSSQSYTIFPFLAAQLLPHLPLWKKTPWQLNF